MNILQLICKQTGKQIGTLRTVFVVRGVGVFRKPESALKAAKGTLRIIRVIIIGKFYYGETTRKKASARLEVKSYPFLRRDEFAKDFGLKGR